MRKLLIMCLCLAMPVAADPVKHLTPVGASEMNWLLWKLYDIRLLSEDGRYRQNRYPLALSIDYARSIEASRLIESTVGEWQRMGTDWDADWPKRLQQIWPSVAAGDRLLMLVTEQRVSRFYFNDQPIGEISDPEFAEAFLSIWLSSKTREPDMRRQLIGESGA